MSGSIINRDYTSIEPVTLDEVKNHLRVDYTAEDNTITRMIKTACDFILNHYGIGTYQHTILLKTDFCIISSLSRNERNGTFYGHIGSLLGSLILELPHSPIISIESIKSINTQNVSALIANTNYTLEEKGRFPIVAFKEGFSFGADLRATLNCEITYKVGYASAEEIPEDIKLAVLELVSYLYGNGFSAVKEAPYNVTGLLSPYLRVTL